MKKLATLSFCFLISHTFSQVNVLESPAEGAKFTHQRTYSVESGKKYIPTAFHAHPDFGKLTFQAPYGKHVVEDISKRTSDSRYYVDLDDPTFFYIEKSSSPINTYIDGYWRAIDPTLHEKSAGYYESGIQPCPTILDKNNQYTGIKLGDAILGFNHYQATITYNDQTVQTYSANWSAINVSNNGAYISNVFPGIDMRLRYLQGGIKSEFVIQENLHVKSITFQDFLTLPSNLTPYLNYDSIFHLTGLHLRDEQQQDIVVFKPAKSSDSGDSRRVFFTPYTFQNSTLSYTCDSLLLNESSRIYPLIIDPLVTVVGPIASPNNLMGSLPSPAACSHTLTITYPGGTTPWDVSAYWNIQTDFCTDDYIDYGFFFDCYMSEAQIWLSSSCGISPVGAPGIVWTCLSPGCASPGTWNPTLPFNSSGTQSLVQCYSPSCSNQSISFTINSNRSYCSNFYGYDNCSYTSNNCNWMNNWSVTVQGRSAETLSNTTTGNGSTTIAAATCASGTQVLNPTPQYGVPGYTYVWSTGATTPTITVPNGAATYTCQVTDACGTVRTATFTITCPLGIELKSFDALAYDTKVACTWSTEEVNSISHFELLRAGSDFIFKPLASIDNTNNNDGVFRYNDLTPLAGVNYYQLALHKTDGTTELSEVRSVNFSAQSSPRILIIPNPNKGSFTLQSKIETSDLYMVEVIGNDGRIYYQTEMQLEQGTLTLPLNLNLKAGIYQIRLRSGNSDVLEKFVVE